MAGYPDISTCLNALTHAGASYFQRDRKDGGIDIVCYSPYVTVDYDTGEIITHCYVYHWVDTFDKDGKFIKHEVYECAYSSELDYSI